MLREADGRAQESPDNPDAARQRVWPLCGGVAPSRARCGQKTV
jgi:hypothetical protein